MNTNESKGEKHDNTSRATWNLDTTWWEVGPIFWEVRVCLIGGDLDVDDPASNQQDSNLATATPLAQLDWPRREGFSCKRIEGHKQEDVNTQSDIANMDEANQKKGSRTWFQRTNRYSGGDQEQGPWINV